MLPSLQEQKKKTMTTLNKPITGRHIILFDGVCGLCDRLVQFTLPKDTQNKFQFASLQSDFGTKLLARYDIDAKSLQSFYVVADYGLESERVYSKSDAAAFVLTTLGGKYKLLAVFKFLPKALRNWAYEFVGKHRYQIFGKSESCRLPSPDDKDRFIEV